MISQTHINCQKSPYLPGNYRGSGPGVTLIELTVAVSLLVLLGTLLLMTFSDSLSLWSTGETQRKQYEESHFLLQKISGDLRNTWVPINADMGSSKINAFKPYMVSGFIPLDGTERRGRWLEFVRSKGGYLTGTDHARLSQRLTRQIYVFLPGKGLYHASVKADKSLPHHQKPDRLTDPAYIRDNLTLIGPNVWNAGFRFWGPWMNVNEGSLTLTGRWPANSPWGAGNGVSLWWDSSRTAFQKFRMHKPDAELPAVPGMVRVRVEMAERGRTSWPRLSNDLPSEAEAGKPLPLETGRSWTPEAGFFLVGQEWIRADSRDGPLTIRKRGARGTEPADHAAGTDVRAGRGFAITVDIPVYPGRQFYYDREVRSRSNTR